MTSPRSSTTWQCLTFDELSCRQLHDIFAARQMVFVVEQTCFYLDADGRDPHSDHVVGWDAQGQLEAYARIVPAGRRFDVPSIGRVLTLPHVRGLGKGHELLRRTLQYCQTRYPGQPLRLAAQVHLEAYYQRHGFSRVAEAYDEDGIPHIDMERMPLAKGV